MLRSLVVLVVLAACGKSTPPAPRDAPATPGFWTWFAAQVPRLTQLANESPVEAMQQIDAEVMRIDEEIGAELAPGTPPEPHTLVLTAHGIREHATLIEKLVATAPPLAGWKVIAFRQRMPMPTIEIAGVQYATSEVRVVATKSGSTLDVIMYIPNGREDPALIGLPILDHHLGEYDVMMKLGALEFEPLAKAPANAITMPELVKLVDALPSTR